MTLARGQMLSTALLAFKFVSTIFLTKIFFQTTSTGLKACSLTADTGWLLHGKCGEHMPQADAADHCSGDWHEECSKGYTKVHTSKTGQLGT